MFYTTIAAIAIAGILNWRKGEKLEDKIDSKIDGLRAEMRADRGEILAAIERLRTETKAAIDLLRTEIVALHERVTRVEERTK
jgi:hypothetical protein